MFPWRLTKPMISGDFQNEEELQEFVVENLADIFERLTGEKIASFEEQRAINPVLASVSRSMSGGIMDIFATDQKGKEWIIELKNSRGNKTKVRNTTLEGMAQIFFYAAQMSLINKRSSLSDKEYGKILILTKQNDEAFHTIEKFGQGMIVGIATKDAIYRFDGSEEKTGSQVL